MAKLNGDNSNVGCGCGDGPCKHFKDGPPPEGCTGIGMSDEELKRYFPDRIPKVSQSTFARNAFTKKPNTQNLTIHNSRPPFMK